MQATFALALLFSICFSSHPRPEPLLIQGETPLVHIQVPECKETSMQMGPSLKLIIDCQSRTQEGDRVVWKLLFNTRKFSRTYPFEAQDFAEALSRLTLLPVDATSVAGLVPLLNDDHGRAGIKIVGGKVKGHPQVIESYIHEVRFSENMGDGVERLLSFLRTEDNQTDVWDVVGTNWKGMKITEAIKACSHILEEHMCQNFSQDQVTNLASLLVFDRIARLKVKQIGENSLLRPENWEVVEIKLSPTDPLKKYSQESEKIVKI